MEKGPHLVASNMCRVIGEVPTTEQQERNGIGRANEVLQPSSTPPARTPMQGGEHGVCGRAPEFYAKPKSTDDIETKPDVIAESLPTKPLNDCTLGELQAIAKSRGVPCPEQQTRSELLRRLNGEN